MLRIKPSASSRFNPLVYSGNGYRGDAPACALESGTIQGRFRGRQEFLGLPDFRGVVIPIDLDERRDGANPRTVVGCLGQSREANGQNEFSHRLKHRSTFEPSP